MILFAVLFSAFLVILIILFTSFGCDWELRWYFHPAIHYNHKISLASSNRQCRAHYSLHTIRIVFSQIKAAWETEGNRVSILFSSGLAHLSLKPPHCTSISGSWEN